MWQEIVVTSAAQSSGGLVYLLVACLDFFGQMTNRLCRMCFCFHFPFFMYWIAQQASSLCVWLIPVAHTPSPSAAVRWKGEGTAIDHFFPLTCTYTPHLQRHYRLTCLMFLWRTSWHFLWCHITSVFCHFVTIIDHIVIKKIQRKRSALQLFIQIISDGCTSTGLWFSFPVRKCRFVWTEAYSWTVVCHWYTYYRLFLKTLTHAPLLLQYAFIDHYPHVPSIIYIRFILCSFFCVNNLSFINEVFLKSFDTIMRYVLILKLGG